MNHESAPVVQQPLDFQTSGGNSLNEIAHSSMDLAPTPDNNDARADFAAAPAEPSTTSTGGSSSGSPRDRERHRALEEAARVLESTALHHHHNLDGFHLLGVVADPRCPGGSQFATTAAAASSSLPSPVHGRYGSNDAATAATATTSSYFDASYYYHSLESTLTSVTGQMGAFNHAIEDWSRHLMEEGDARESEIPDAQLKELPAEIDHLDYSALAAYLNRSGAQAAAFEQLLRTDGPAFDRNSTGNRSLSADSADPQDELVDVSDIPRHFFEIDFDLTDPHTFRELLLMGGVHEPAASPAAIVDANNTASVLELLPLLPPDALSGHLDKVELALLQQVRFNSDKFFAESQRFGQLQEWIQSLLQQVVDVQAATRHLQSDLLEPMETVPVADAQRADMRKLEAVLERAEDMLLCKHGLGGILSAQDDLTAVEQIQYGRRLLDGTWDKHQRDNGHAIECVELGRLRSFKAASNQLSQYEQLVVSNLRDELVEMFLAWNSTAALGAESSAAYGGGGAAALSATKASPLHHVKCRVREITSALRSCKALSKTRDAYATRLQDVIRMTVRTTVGEFAVDVAPSGAVQSVAMGASSMTLQRFMDCLDMLFEQLLALLTSASMVDEFLVAEGVQIWDGDSVTGENDARGELRGSTDESSPDTSHVAVPVTPLSSVVAAASELSSKSISELLRLRKDAHSLVTLGEMKAIWDACMTFTLQLETLSGTGHTSTLRTTLSAQAKSFVERRHESNMSSLAAALDSERWVQCEVSSSRQAALSRLCSGLSVLSFPLNRSNGGGAVGTDGALLKSPEMEAEGTRYKVVWSCLLLVEMVLINIATAAQFPNLASSIVGKVSELLRLFNSRTTQLVLGAGAIHSHAKLKSINAKHLSLVTQCLGMIMAVLPHIRAGLMAQLPKKQHALLSGLDQIRKEYGEHNDKVLNKFVTIIGGIVEHNLAKTIPDTDFDARAKSVQTANGTVSCCVFLEGVATNTRKMHQVLHSLLPPDHLIDTFSRIFAFIDTRVPALFVAAANIQPVFQQKSGSDSPRITPQKGQPTFIFPKTDEGKRQFLTEIEMMTKSLNSLEGVRAWDFAALNVIERELEYSLHEGPKKEPNADPAIEEHADDTLDTESNPARLPVIVDDSPNLDGSKENGTMDADEERLPTLSLQSTDTENASPNQKADLAGSGLTSLETSTATDGEYAAAAAGSFPVGSTELNGSQTAEGNGVAPPENPEARCVPPVDPDETRSANDEPIL